MAFDADALAFDGRCVSTDPALSATFTAAFDWVLKETGEVDGFLDMGSLDCPLAIHFLGLGLGRRCGLDAGIWSPDDVRAMASAARWPDIESVPPDQRWGYWSARKFAEVCVEQGLGIWFN